MNKKQVIRLNEKQIHNIVKEVIENVVQNQIKGQLIPMDYAIEWLMENVEDYVIYDDCMVIPSMRAQFELEDFIKDFKAAMQSKVQQQ